MTMRALAVAFLLGLGAPLFAITAHAQSGEVSAPVGDVPSEEPAEPLLPQGCAVMVTDEDAGAEGGGEGPTLEAATQDGMAKCEAQGGKNCKVTMTSCNPN